MDDVKTRMDGVKTRTDGLTFYKHDAHAGGDLALIRFYKDPIGECECEWINLEIANDKSFFATATDWRVILERMLQMINEGETFDCPHIEAEPESKVKVKAGKNKTR
jgi:hypothetical protein